jgi:hypothetical protein
VPKQQTSSHRNPPPLLRTTGARATAVAVIAHRWRRGRRRENLFTMLCPPWFAAFFTRETSLPNRWNPPFRKAFVIKGREFRTVVRS